MEKKSWQEWKTTVTGVVTLVLGILVAFGIVTPEQSGELSLHIGSLGEVISGSVIAVSGIVNVFRAK